MAAFRMVLIAMILVMIILTITAVQNEGLDGITPFFTPIFELAWQGQYRVDFICYLILSGIWMAWRSGFSTGGILMGVFLPPFAILFFAPYLLYLIGKTGGDPRKILLGVHA